MQLPSTSSLEFLHKEWPVITAAPYSFFGSLGILLFIGWIILRLLYRSRIDRHKETIEYLERENARLKSSSVTTPEQKVEPQRESVQDAFKNPRWEIVSDHSFANQSLEIDGKSFRNCSFTNTTLTYSGTAPAEFQGCHYPLRGSVTFDTRAPALMEYARLERYFRSLPNVRSIREAALDAKGKIIPTELQISSELVPSPSPDLCARVLMLGKALQEFLKLHGPEPKVTRQLLETPEAFQERWREVVMPWRTTFVGDYRMRFREPISRICDEIKAKQGMIYDARLDFLTNLAETNPNGDVETIGTISTILWNMALRIDEGV
jgi:hypothetical protein